MKNYKQIKIRKTNMSNKKKVNDSCRNTFIEDIDTELYTTFKESGKVETISKKSLHCLFPNYTEKDIEESLDRLEQKNFITKLGKSTKNYKLVNQNKGSPYYQNQANEIYILDILKYHSKGLTKLELQTQLEIRKGSPVSTYHFNKAITFLKGNKNIYKHKNPCK